MKFQLNIHFTTGQKLSYSTNLFWYSSVEYIQTVSCITTAAIFGDRSKLDQYNEVRDYQPENLQCK